MDTASHARRASPPFVAGLILAILAAALWFGAYRALRGARELPAALAWLGALACFALWLFRLARARGGGLSRAMAVLGAGLAAWFAFDRWLAGHRRQFFLLLHPRVAPGLPLDGRAVGNWYLFLVDPFVLLCGVALLLLLLEGVALLGWRALAARPAATRA